MSLIAELFLARNDGEAARYETAANAFADREQFGGIMTLTLSTLWAILENKTWEDRFLDDFVNVVEKDGGLPTIDRLPPAFVEGLAGLTPDRIREVAEEWAATEEMMCDGEDLRPVIEGLVRISRLAKTKGQNVYLYNC